MFWTLERTTFATKAIHSVYHNVTSTYALTVSPASTHIQSCLMQFVYTWSVQLIERYVSATWLSELIWIVWYADAQSLGQILQDLSRAYHEQEVPCRQESRLKWQQFLGQSAGFLSSTAHPSGETGSLGCAAKCTWGMHMLLLFTSAAAQMGSMCVLLIATCYFVYVVFCDSTYCL